MYGRLVVHVCIFVLLSQRYGNQMIYPWDLGVTISNTTIVLTHSCVARIVPHRPTPDESSRVAPKHWRSAWNDGCLFLVTSFTTRQAVNRFIPEFV